MIARGSLSRWIETEIVQPTKGTLDCKTGHGGGQAESYDSAKVSLYRSSADCSMEPGSDPTGETSSNWLWPHEAVRTCHTACWSVFTRI